MVLGRTPVAFGETDGTADSTVDILQREKAEIILQIWAADQGQLNHLKQSLPVKGNRKTY